MKFLVFLSTNIKDEVIISSEEYNSNEILFRYNVEPFDTIQQARDFVYNEALHTKHRLEDFRIFVEFSQEES